MPTLKMTTAGKSRAKSDKRGGEHKHTNRERESRKGEAETGSIHGEIHILRGGEGSEEQRLHYLSYLPENKQSWKKHPNNTLTYTSLGS